jgi:predicted TIM-barrel fold metal-dependent hydrolase
LKLIDVSVFGGSWPFRAHARRTPEQLKAYLTARGVGQAWLASASAVFYPDPMAGNEELFAETGEEPFFIKVAVIDVTLATWERDLTNCFERLGCLAVKLFPNYHGYGLDDPRVLRLVALCRERRAPVCIQVRMMDERGHHTLMKVPAVPVEQVVALAQRAPGARFLVCGAYQGELHRLREAGNVWADLSFVESGHTLRVAVNALGAQRLVFGSHTPLHSFGAGAAKLDVPPGDVEPDTVRRIRAENALSLLRG